MSSSLSPRTGQRTVRREWEKLTWYTVVTIGLSLTIPLALIGSLFIPSSSADAITLLSLSGAALVVAGFVMLGWQGWEESQAQGGAVAGRDPSEVEAEQDGNV